MTAELVKSKCNEIWELMRDIGDIIGDAPTESAADKLHDIVRRELDNHIAEEIWSNYVDWEKVKW